MAEALTLLRQTEYNRMCKIQRDIYRFAVVPDDFDEYADIPLTMRKAFDYQFAQGVERRMVQAVVRMEL